MSCLKLEQLLWGVGSSPCLNACLSLDSHPLGCCGKALLLDERLVIRHMRVNSVLRRLLGVSEQHITWGQ